MPGALRKQKSVPNAVHAVQLSFDDGVNRGMERPDMSELDQLVEILLAKHEPGLKLPAIRIASRMRRTLGSYAGRKRRISMSAHLLALGSDEQKREILLHELAHALVHHRFEKAAAHGKEFKDACRQLGVSPTRTVDLPVAVWLARQRYAFVCPVCERLNLRKRKMRSVRCECGHGFRPEKALVVSLREGEPPILLGTASVSK
jgi:predicted SprT family Zn-dependent metalloprotease